jgi:flagellar biosynthetic protein FliR
MGFDVPLEQLVALLLATFRCASFLLLAPPFSHRAIPGQVKAMLALGLALAVMPDVPDALLADGLDAGALVVSAGQEVVVGSGLGFLVMAVFSAVRAAGDLLDLFGGFSLAFAFDPGTQSGSAVLGRTFQLTALALLFATNGYAVVLGGLVRTFEVLPVGQLLELDQLAASATGALTGMFVASLQIAGPMIAVLFLADVGLGLLTRVAPALNAFALGFPLKILITLVVAGLAFVSLPAVIEGLVDDATRTVVGTARG